MPLPLPDLVVLPHAVEFVRGHHLLSLTLGSQICGTAADGIPGVQTASGQHRKRRGGMPPQRDHAHVLLHFLFFRAHAIVNRTVSSNRTVKLTRARWMLMSGNSMR